MCGSVAFLAVLVWFFSAESRSDTFLSKITRDHLDSFTNDFCGPCSKYEATPTKNSSGSCTCSGSLKCLTDTNKPRGSVFVRSKGKCESSCNLTSSNKCFYWRHFEPLIVLDLQDSNSNQFRKEIGYVSCKWGQTIAYLDTSGNWEQVNLSPNAFQVLPVNGQELMRNPSIRVNERSASLTKLGGHIMKLGLNCTKKDNKEIIRTCLIFKSKGKLNFTLCNYTVTTTTSPPPPSSSNTTVNSTDTPSSIYTTTTPPSGVVYPLIVALLTLLALCLTLGASVMCFCYFKRGSTWNLHRRERRDFADNQDEQTYIKQEDQEPVYVELPDVLPVDSNSSDPSSAVTAERKQCTEDVVIVNPYVSRALFAAGRSPTSDPLSRKPIQKGNTPTQEPTGNLNVTDGQDMSIVLKNPRVRESSVESSSLLRSDVDNLTTPREDEEKVVKLRHPHSRETDEDNLDYQDLAERTRVKSLFVCPCCDKNVHYQRLSTPDQCECERKDRPSQKRQSIYESLSQRESFYVTPLRAPKEIEGSRNMKQSPEYQTLESDEIDSNQAPVENVYHDYNELEEPEQTCCEADEDNNKSSRLSQHADVDSEIPRKLLEILHADDNPVYTFACKEKKEESKVNTRERSRSI